MTSRNRPAPVVEDVSVEPGRGVAGPVVAVVQVPFQRARAHVYDPVFAMAVDVTDRVLGHGVLAATLAVRVPTPTAGDPRGHRAQHRDERDQGEEAAKQVSPSSRVAVDVSVGTLRDIRSLTKDLSDGSW